MNKGHYSRFAGAYGAVSKAMSLNWGKPIKVEYTGNENPALDEIHKNTTLSREEKIVLAKHILEAEEANEIKKQRIETKSKVCIIANNLIKQQNISRSEAFKKAWETVKISSINTRVSGVSFGKRQEALKRLKQYDTEQIDIQLEREANNEYDNNAIAIRAIVKGKGGYIVGYLPAKLAKLISPLIDYGKKVKAIYQGIIGKYEAYHNYGLELTVKI